MRFLFVCQFLAETLLELAFEVGSEEALADGVTNLLHGPETATVEFFGRGTDSTVVDGAMDIDEFALTLALEHIFADELWREFGDA